MKTKRLLFNSIVCIALLFASLAQAKTWRVNNQSNYDGSTAFGENYGGTPSFPVFKQIDEAVNNINVVAGDTLHIEGSTLVYDDATINKQLVIIGPGYFLDENPNVSNNILESQIGWMEFDSGSEGSQVIGMHFILGTSADGTVYVNTNGITVKRCHIERDVDFVTGLNDVYILQNFFSNPTYNALNTGESSAFIPPQEIVFNYNICQKKLVWSSGTWGTGTIMECNNNVFDGVENELNLQFLTSSFQNNIVRTAGFTANINNGTNNNVQYNTVPNSSSAFSGTTGNVSVPSMALLFVDSGTTDGSYQLKSDPTYNQAGSDGAERGVFGGVAVGNRYNLSGLGAIPVAYDVTTTGVSEPGTGLPVTVKARTNN